MKRSKLWLGLSGVATFLFTLLIVVTILANNFAGYINGFFGLTGGGLTLKGSDYGDENGNLTEDGWSKLIKDSYDFCVQEVEEGSVMLKNDGALPLEKEERNVTLFGNNSAHTIWRSGAGGPTPNPEYQIDMAKAFKDAGFNINQKLYDAYAESGIGAGVHLGQTHNVGEVNKKFYTTALKNTFKDYNDVAIVTFARFGTENVDPTKGILKLDKNEEDLLKMINESKLFDKIIVLLNGPLAMELGWLKQYNVNACIWFGNPGYYGLPGVVNLLTGEANPSGHNTFTFAANSLGSPAMQNWGNYNYQGTTPNMGAHYVVYKEGIYVGYKYYETRYEDVMLEQGKANSATGAIAGAESWKYQDEVCYPFGFGLSYSEYTQTLDSLTYDANTDTFKATVTVKNTNNLAGKASVQLYAQSPYTDYDKTNGVEKASIQLMGYEKVDVPANGTETVEIEVARYLLASYDSVYGNGGYIFEPGTYYFAIGNGAHEAVNHVLGAKGVTTGLVDHDGNAFTADANCVKTYDPKLSEIDRKTYKNSLYAEDVEVKNQFDDADLNYWADDNQKIKYLTRNDWASTFPTEVTTLHANERIAAGLDMAQYKKADDAPSYAAGKGTVYEVKLDKPLNFADMQGVPYDDPRWDELVSQLSLDDLIISIADQRGIQGVATINKPGNTIAEGPEGLLAKFSYGDKRAATGFPTLPTVAASWDHKLQTKYGNMFAEEALFCGVAMVNAPGCNTIRTPYTSRASEYFSEDAALSYYSVSNVILAMRTKGLICNVKHCFLNEQETNRHGVSTFCNEQAIREIYLKPFEGALTRGKSLGIMTAYNRIGLQYAATHKPLMQNVLRGEWGYEGSIIDDALTFTANYSVGADMLMAGTNIWCLDGQRGQEIKRDIINNDDGAMLKELQEANKRIFFALIHSSMGGSIDGDYVFDGSMPWWQAVVITIDVVAGALAVGAIVVYVLNTYLKKNGSATEIADGNNAGGNSNEL